jgi:hypothetical protein
MNKEMPMNFPTDARPVLLGIGGFIDIIDILLLLRSNTSFLILKTKESAPYRT